VKKRALKLPQLLKECYPFNLLVSYQMHVPEKRQKWFPTSQSSRTSLPALSVLDNLIGN